MVYNAHSHWVYGLCSLSEILITREHNIYMKMYLFTSSDDQEKTPILLGPLGRANLNHWNSSF
jgi:hypothetical protein